ncbi:MAG: DUF2325 domain-containing protein [Desulfovibrio sp.]|jgi:hypothetical protein|nr:DUF2325 domain-containing protein [Desulfovibrio sp.]
MDIALVGGLDRLHKEYASVARKCGVRLRMFTGKEAFLKRKLGHPDAAILMTDMVSHNARDIVLQSSRSMDIPVMFLRSSGISALSRSLKKMGAAGVPSPE